MIMDERYRKIDELQKKYPILKQALDISRQVMIITNVWANDEEVKRTLEELEELLKKQKQGAE